MFEPYYKQLRGVAALKTPSPYALGTLLATKSLQLVEPASVAARTVPSVAKCVKGKSSEGKLWACSFCKSGIYHNTVDCLQPWRRARAGGVVRAQELPVVLPQVLQEGQVGA